MTAEEKQMGLDVSFHEEPAYNSNEWSEEKRQKHFRLVKQKEIACSHPSEEDRRILCT